MPLLYSRRSTSVATSLCTFELMLAEVHRYEGTVNQFLGDGIMAIFGAPIAHEDHAQRAILAALGIRKALEAFQDQLRSQRGISFQIRQGINTGLVVVGSIGNDLRMDYTAVGDTTNVAARLQQAADPGRIVISDPTARLVTGYFYMRPLAEFRLKGKASPVRAWEIVAMRSGRTRMEVGAERGLTTFVGRERELRVLLECFEKAQAGHGQVAFVVGEAGIGKSRLLYEFRRLLGEDATWLEGHCLSFGQSITFHPILDLLRRNFRIDEGDSEEAIIKKIEQSVARLGEDLRPTLPYLRYLLSVDPGTPAVLTMDPAQRRIEIFDAVRRLTLRACEVRPQVAVIEDLHWIDQTSQEYLSFFADSIPTSRFLLLLTYRPGYSHPFGERTFHTRVVLSPLSTENSVQLAQAALATDALPEDLRRLVLRKAEGNPFFLEEVVRSLQEVGAVERAGNRLVLTRPVEDALVPETIHDVIMARIDRLEERAKQTLQLASVIGREFTRRLLDRIGQARGPSEQLLRDLKAIELIYEKSVFPELAYMFKHALTHEVAYSSMLVQRRKQLHHLIGVAIEELYVDRLAEQYEILAHHFSRAEEWAKAVHYLRQAGTKAFARSANREALAYFEQALTALTHLPETRETLEQAIDLRFDLRPALFALGDRVRLTEHLREAERLAQALGDQLRLGRVSLHKSHYLWSTGHAAEARASGENARAIAEKLGDLPLQVGANHYLGAICLTSGNYRQAEIFLRKVVHLVSGDQSRDRCGLTGFPAAMARGWLAWAGRAWSVR
jgi:tetratricopeptide (TPR) repeat protein